MSESTTDFLFVPTHDYPEMLLDFDPKIRQMTFYSGDAVVGVLKFGEEITFEGNCDDSAKAFWDALVSMAYDGHQCSRPVDKCVKSPSNTSIS